jgi:hypothetical protein
MDHDGQDEADEDGEEKKMDLRHRRDEEAEKFILEQFGQCLMEIIETAEKRSLS